MDETFITVGPWQLCTTPPSILTLVTCVPLAVWPPALGHHNPTVCSLPCPWRLRSAMRANQEFFQKSPARCLIMRPYANSSELSYYSEVGPVDNRPSTNKLNHFVKKIKKMWHVTCDTGHVTRDTWHVWRVSILSKFQLPSSYCMWFMILWRFGGKGWINKLINDKAVYRTAPATPGMLIIAV